ncbi:autotransporter outer membrane beta-barrel domain-containing protein [Ensifer sp. Root423]
MFPNFDWPDGRPDVGPQPVFPDFDWPDGRPDVGPQPLPPDFDWPDGRPDVGPQPVFPGFNPRKPTAAKGGRVIAARTPDTCIDPRSKDSKQRRDLPTCRDLAAEEATARSADRSSQVPLTPGRDLPAPSLWNFWSDIHRRHFRRAFSPDELVVGMTVSLEDSSADAFDGTLGIDTDGFSFGPYAAYRLSKHWAIDGSLTYGRYDNDIELDLLNGQQDSQRLAGEISLHGQYKVDAYFIRPKASVSWSHIESDSYDLSGSILNIPVTVSLPGDSFNYRVLDLSTEVSRYFRLPNGRPFLVFTELGAEYQFERPNDGKITTGNLSEMTPSPWSFSLRSGSPRFDQLRECRLQHFSRLPPVRNDRRGSCMRHGVHNGWRACCSKQQQLLQKRREPPCKAILWRRRAKVTRTFSLLSQPICCRSRSRSRRSTI